MDLMEWRFLGPSNFDFPASVMMVRPLKQISPARWLQLRVQLAELMSNDANDKKSAERKLTATFQSEEAIFDHICIGSAGIEEW